VYLIIWSGVAKDRVVPTSPPGIKRPTTATELQMAMESVIPDIERARLRVVVLNISPSGASEV